MSLMTNPVGASASRVTPGTSTAGQNAEFKLGTRGYGHDNGEYIYVQASAALLAATTDPNAVAISSAYQASLMTTALALANNELGFAPPLVINQYDFFWARVAGTGLSLTTARVSASASANKYLRTTITAGRLGTASTASAVVFDGVTITAAASASTSAGNSVRAVMITKGRVARQGLSTFV